MRQFVLSIAMAVVVLAGSAFAATQAYAGSGVHKLALQISDNDKQKMNTILNVAANVSRYYGDKGEEIEIEIVAFNAGLHMLRDDTSPVKKRIASFSQSMPNVKFQACANTIQGMTKKEGKEPPLVAAANVVPAGVVRLIELNEAGWTIVRP
jgi:intracellular sulfur oxidation DsrE/DsrF family protein